MSKFAIFLCLTVFASATSAFFSTSRLDQAQQGLNNLLESTITQVKSTVNDAKRKSDELVAELEAKVQEYRDQVSADVHEKLNKAISEIRLLVSDVKNVDVTECAQLGEHLHGVARHALVDMKKCFVDKREKAVGYVENMFKVADGVLTELSVYKMEAHACIDAIDGFFSVGKALLCTNKVAAKAAWSAAKAVPSISIEATKLTFLMTTLPTTLTYCTTTSALATFYYEISVVASKTSKCVEQKVQEFRDSANKHPQNPDVPESSERPDEPEFTEASNPVPEVDEVSNPVPEVDEVSSPVPEPQVDEVSSPVPEPQVDEVSSPVPEVDEQQSQELPESSE